MAQGRCDVCMCVCVYVRMCVCVCMCVCVYVYLWSYFANPVVIIYQLRRFNRIHEVSKHSTDGSISDIVKKVLKPRDAVRNL